MDFIPTFQIQLFFEKFLFLREIRNSIDIFRKIIESDKAIKQTCKIADENIFFFLVKVHAHKVRKNF